MCGGDKANHVEIVRDQHAKAIERGVIWHKLYTVKKKYDKGKETALALKSRCQSPWKAFPKAPSEYQDSCCELISKELEDLEDMSLKALVKIDEFSQHIDNAPHTGSKDDWVKLQMPLKQLLLDAASMPSNVQRLEDSFAELAKAGRDWETVYDNGMEAMDNYRMGRDQVERLMERDPVQRKFATNGMRPVTHSNVSDPGIYKQPPTPPTIDPATGKITLCAPGKFHEGYGWEKNNIAAKTAWLCQVCDKPGYGVGGHVRAFPECGISCESCAKKEDCYSCDSWGCSACQPCKAGTKSLKLGNGGRMCVPEDTVSAMCEEDECSLERFRKRNYLRNRDWGQKASSIQRYFKRNIFPVASKCKPPTHAHKEKMNKELLKESVEATKWQPDWKKPWKQQNVGKLEAKIPDLFRL